MRICRITSAFPPPWEGLGPGPYELSLAQAKSGHRITVITKYIKNCEIIDEKVPFKVYRIKSKLNLMFSFLATIKFFCLHLRKEYDIIHNHGNSSIILLILRRLLLMKVPVITSVHIIRKAQYKQLEKVDIFKTARLVLGNEMPTVLSSSRANRRELFIEKLYLKLSDRLAVVSEGLKKDIKNEYKISDNISVILNGVNPNNFFINNDVTRKNRRRIFLINCRYLILFVGVLNGRKGEFDLIKAMENVVSVYPDAGLTIIGNGPTREIAIKMSECLHIRRNIHFIPNVPYNEIQKYFMCSDVFVLPSYSEGMPKVLLEALASGLTVIASAIPPHKEIIKEGVNGFLYEPGNIKDLASRIKSALKNSGNRKKLSFNAKEIIRSKYTWKSVAEKLDRVYEHIIS